MSLMMPQRISSAGQKCANQRNTRCHSSIPMVPIRPRMPMMIKTTGPAKERGGRTGLIGGAGGGTCTVLAIFHLAIHLSRRLLLVRTAGNWRHCRGMISAKVAALHQFQDSNYQQDQRPCAPEPRHVPPMVMQIIQQENYAERNQHSRTGKAAMPKITTLCG